MHGIERKAFAVVEDAESKFGDLQTAWALGSCENSDSAEAAMRTAGLYDQCCVNCLDMRAANFDGLMIQGDLACLDGIVGSCDAFATRLNEPAAGC